MDSGFATRQKASGCCKRPHGEISVTAGARDAWQLAQSQFISRRDLRRGNEEEAKRLGG